MNRVLCAWHVVLDCVTGTMNRGCVCCVCVARCIELCDRFYEQSVRVRDRPKFGFGFDAERRLVLFRRPFGFGRRSCSYKLSDDFRLRPKVLASFGDKPKRG